MVWDGLGLKRETMREKSFSSYVLSNDKLIIQNLTQDTDEDDIKKTPKKRKKMSSDSD